MIDRHFFALFVGIGILLGGCPTGPDGKSPEETGDSLVDEDGDGSPADVDCNDSDVSIHPGAVETCDGVDDDCDGLVDDEDDGVQGQATWYPDDDGDGYGADGQGLDACDAPAGSVAIDGDCDDSESASHPGATELCDGVDNDCDGDEDEDAVDASTWYRDDDSDGYGDPSSSTQACDQPRDYVANADDCDDSEAAAWTGAQELCDGVDNDCDGATDEEIPTWYQDADGDGFGDPSSATQSCDQPGDHVANSDDCDDSEAAAWTGADEYCDGVDNDCNGTMDDDYALDASTWYLDADTDGHGNAPQFQQACEQPRGYVVNADDCDDAASETHPGADERCDGVDNDCNGVLDDDYAVDALTWYVDADLDGYGDPFNTAQNCQLQAGYTTDATDCDDGDATNFPGALSDHQGIAMVCIPHGIFTMGSPVSEVGRYSNETQHVVTLTRNFHLGAYELTQAEFQAFMGYNPSSFVGCGGDCPVENLSWSESAAFTNALSAAAGLPSCYTCSGLGSAVTCNLTSNYPNTFECPGYRLPTEAEWEYAARAGETHAYAGSDVVADVAWYTDNSGGQTHLVGQLDPNAWGLYDMSGNVYEWAGDWWDNTDYDAAAVTDPTGDGSGSYRVNRSGAWNSSASLVRAATRLRSGPSAHYYNLGVRVARSGGV